MASRNIFDLSTRARSLYVRFDACMKKAGVDYIVTCTHRSNDEQQKLYDQGRITRGSIVTNARPGQSLHNRCDLTGRPCSDAFDIVIMKNGKPDWDIANPDWQKAGKIGESIGLEWAGRWTKFREYPHFQLPQGINK